MIRATVRLRCEGRQHLDAIRARGGRYIHTFWHGHLFLMPYAYAGGRIAILISEHTDGEYIARTMARFGHESVRGSTTSGGAAALRNAVRKAREGYDLGFTPDGPRGPRHRAQMGVVAAARLTGLPIVPVAFAASRAKVMGSWDGFILPLPFSRGVFVYGEPIVVDEVAEGPPVDLAAKQTAAGARSADRTTASFVGSRPTARTGTATETREDRTAGPPRESGLEGVRLEVEEALRRCASRAETLARDRDAFAALAPLPAPRRVWI